MSTKNVRFEVMQFLEKNIDSFVDNYLIPVENFGNHLICYPIQNQIIFLKKLEN
ncbi:hypothetical protein [Paenimyroides ceti]|uniref:hypothetical protein n=1 Tax=Paenimyroides ceti TaxID=395087 RepID=UPI0037C67554